MLPSGRRQLRILVTAPGHLRAYLAADLLRRTAERSGLLPEVSELVPAGAQATRLRATCEALNIHPPVATLHAAGASTATGMPPFDVAFGTGGGATGKDPSGARLWARVGADDQPEADLSVPPLAVRLSLLRCHYDEPLGDDWAPASDVETLTRWRALVAQWAQTPSGAMSKPHADAITAAFARDLDSPSALASLDALAGDPAVMDGVKFETFAAADRLFGLDLAADIGKY